VSGNPFLHFSRTAISAAAAIVIAAPALAQNTTAGVGGRVTGADGQPVAGATVTILHVESGSSNSAVTGADGRYAARGLRVGGPYTITISKAGQVDRRDNVFLSLAELTSVDAVLGAGGQTVVVTGQAAAATQFNSSTMGAGTNVSGRQLQALASIQRNLQDYARTDPRVAQTDKERGEISAGGQNSRYNSITIDGVTTNDTFGLESNNLPTAKQPISIDAIQSVQVNISNYDVTQKGYTGANINAVTRSGTNDFRGSVYWVTRNDEYTGQRYTRSTDTFTDTPVFTENTKGFTLGGPIVKDKLFFFGAYEELKSSRTSPDWGPIGSTRSNVGITPSAITGLQNIAKTSYGFDLGGTEIPQGTFLTVKDTLLKLDWNINNQHRANIRYTKTDQAEPIFSNIGSRDLSLSSHWYDQVKTVESVVAQWFADWTPDLSTEFKLSKRDYESEPKNYATLPYMAFDFGGSVPAGVATGERRLHTGTERSRHFNQLFTTTWDAYLGATWTLGKHEVKFGADLSKNDIFNAFLQDANGQYKFQCESSWAYSFGNINCTTATTAQIEAAVLENFQRGRPSAYQAQLPLPGKALADGIAQWKLGSTGLFVQDTFPLNDKVTLTVGARLDKTDMPEKPIANPAVATAMVAGNPATNTRQTGGFGYDNTNTLDGKSLFQPRLGFNWNLGSKERRMQLRGGLGLFEGAAANVWLSNPYSNTGRAVAFYGCGPSGELVGGITRANCPPTDGTFKVARADQLALGANPAPNVDILAPGLAQPAVWKANLAFDTELPWYGLTAGVEWLHTDVKRAITYENLNLGAPTRTGPDGRDLFYNTQGFNPACWNATGAAITTGAACTGFTTRALSNSAFGNVLLAKPTSDGKGDAVTLSLQRPLRGGFAWSAAYTYTTSTEVSPLTSSVALSNWRARSIFNPNEGGAAQSTYTVRDRVSASATYQHKFLPNLNTTFGLFYEGRKGKPYSWTFNNDMNGDGQGGNDLMYIPKAFGSGDVIFRGDTAASKTNETRFWDIVNSFPELQAAAGGVAKRNGSYSNWVNSFDLRISQEIAGLRAGHRGVLTLDFLNFGNLINSKYGQINEISFQSDGGPARSFVDFVGVDPATGKYIYSMRNLEDYAIRQQRGESQWAVQLTLKYEF
jgi:Carboxypeptidase regulatory-like domain/TonB dependent receptor